MKSTEKAPSILREGTEKGPLYRVTQGGNAHRFRLPYAGGVEVIGSFAEPLPLSNNEARHKINVLRAVLSGKAHDQACRKVWGSSKEK